MKNLYNLPEDIHEKMSYLSYIFARDIKHILCSEEDLYQELVIFYLQKKKQNVINSIGGWFISFKNFLIDKQRHYITEERAYENYRKEQKRNRK